MEIQAARPAWIEVNLARLRHNIEFIKNKITHKVKLMVIVKANAYGHGAVEVAKVAMNHGAYALGVATIMEGMELRLGGITAPILVIGAIDEREVDEVVEYGLIPTLFTIPVAQALQLAAQKKQITIKYHLRVDTAGGSLGIGTEEVSAFVNKMKELSSLELAGVYTHFYGTYSQNDQLVRCQISQFNHVVAAVRRLISQPIIVHAASSPGIVNWPETYYDMVRAGSILYGLPEMDIIDRKTEAAIECKPVMQLKARIVDVKKIAPGCLWMYSYQQLIPKETRVAIVPLGYADGFPLAYIQNSQILIGGQKVSVLGKVAMDYFSVDVTLLKSVAIGDEVVVWGEQANEVVTVDDIVLQSKIGTVEGTGNGTEMRISTESLCLLSTRLPRLYINSILTK